MADSKRHNGGPVARLAEGLAEERVRLGLSRRQLGELTGYSGGTVRNAEQGRTRHPLTVMRLRTALAMVAQYGKVGPEPAPELLTSWEPLARLFELEVS